MHTLAICIDKFSFIPNRHLHKHIFHLCKTTQDCYVFKAHIKHTGTVGSTNFRIKPKRRLQSVRDSNRTAAKRRKVPQTRLYRTNRTHPCMPVRNRTRQAASNESPQKRARMRSFTRVFFVGTEGDVEKDSRNMLTIYPSNKHPQKGRGCRYSTGGPASSLLDQREKHSARTV